MRWEPDSNEGWAGERLESFRTFPRTFRSSFCHIMPRLGSEGKWWLWRGVGAWGPVVPGLVKLQSFWRFYFYPLFNNQEHRKKCAFIPLCFYYISMKKRWTGAYPAVRCFLRPGVSARWALGPAPSSPAWVRAWGLEPHRAGCETSPAFRPWPWGQFTPLSWFLICEKETMRVASSWGFVGTKWRIDVQCLTRHRD